MARQELTAYVVGALALLTHIGCDPAPSAEAIDNPVVERLRQGIAEGDGRFDHSSYDRLLSTYVDQQTGRVDYAGFQKDESTLDEYLTEIAGADLTRLSQDAQLALLINAYNASTMKLILEHYPGIESIRELSDPWSTVRWEIGGQTLSLDQIEHGLIRPLYRDPRIHFAVNCAARDCPHLAESAYTGEMIDRQLASRTRATLSNKKFVRLENGELRYTRVMDWYREDFLDPSFRRHATSIPRYVARYGTAKVRRFIERHDGDPPASPLEYDWALNDVR